MLWLCHQTSDKCMDKSLHQPPSKLHQPEMTIWSQMLYLCAIHLHFNRSISALWLTNSSIFISTSFCIPCWFHIFLILDMCRVSIGTEGWVMIIMISYMASHSAFFLLADLLCLVIRPLGYLDIQFPLALHQFWPQCLEVDRNPKCLADLEL